MDHDKNRELLVAASCGPYVSFANKGWEYSDHGSDIAVDVFFEQHKEKFNIFVDYTDVDIIAFETIPCLNEVEGILQLVKTRQHAKALIAVTCKDAEHLMSGEHISDFVKLVEKYDTAGQIETLGVNCVAPEHVTTLIKTMRSLTERTLIVYPNNGDTFEPDTKSWIASEGHIHCNDDFVKEALEWKEVGGPIIIGGCCRIDKKLIKQLADALRETKTQAKL